MWWREYTQRKKEIPPYLLQTIRSKSWWVKAYWSTSVSNLVAWWKYYLGLYTLGHIGHCGMDLQKPQLTYSSKRWRSYFCFLPSSFEDTILGFFITPWVWGRRIRHSPKIKFRFYMFQLTESKSNTSWCYTVFLQEKANCFEDFQ